MCSLVCLHMWASNPRHNEQANVLIEYLLLHIESRGKVKPKSELEYVTR